MRLTNITHARLPEGPISSCSLVVTELGREVPVSFDQGMHAGGGPRPGTWMAVSFTLPGPATRDELGGAWRRVAYRHHTLRTVFESDDVSHLRLREIPGEPVVQWHDHASSPDGARQVLGAVLDEGCSPFARPPHKLCFIDAPEAPTVILAADHCHVDAWSLPLLAHDFLAALEAEKQGMPLQETDQAASFAEHTAELARRPAAPPEVAERWREILADGDGTMPVFPLPLGEVDPLPQETVTTRDLLDAAGLAAFEQRAQGLQQRPLTLLVSAMTRATADLAGRPLRAVLPVHSRTDERWRDAVGWFITNSVLVSSDPALPACRSAVREALALGSHALEPIMRPYGGMPVPAGMFMISYLDYRRLPAALPASLNAQHVSASAPTNGVQVWFVAAEDGLHLRARYPDTPEARESVSRWLTAVADHLVTAVIPEVC